MTEDKKHEPLLKSLIYRWDNNVYKWEETAAFCQGAAMGNSELTEEYGFLNSIAWTRKDMEDDNEHT